MKKTLLAAFLATLVGAAANAMAQNAAAPGQPSSTGKAAASSQIARGKYLVTIGGCNDCHSPKVFTPKGPQLDQSKLLSGHPANAPLPAIPASAIGPSPAQWGAITTGDLTAWAGPWGVSFAANLTPDATGMKGWTPEIFIKTMRTGKHMGEGRPILPPMPWESIAALTDQDLRAMFAYLQSLKPVANPVPPAIAPNVAPTAAPAAQK